VYFSQRDRFGIREYVHLHYELGLQCDLDTIMDGPGNPGGECIRAWIEENQYGTWPELLKILVKWAYVPRFLERVSAMMELSEDAEDYEIKRKTILNAKRPREH